MSGLMRMVISLVVTTAVAFVGLGTWLYATQRSLIYFPTPEVHAADAEVLWVENQGERIKVWTVRRPGSPALLYFGGNAEDVAGDIDLLAAALPEYSLYLVNYRGYGGSSGRPSESALFADALAVYDRVRADGHDVAVMGRSLGSGVAVYLASERPIVKLVLVTPFDSLVNVARAHMRWLPVGLLMRDRYESARRAPAIRVPVLVVIAAEDEIVPRASSDALAASFAPDQVEVAVIPGATHNTLDLSPGYLSVVREFLAPL
jgi:pimeloyl-ACP methyl ester carboxylesterase